MIGSYFCNEIFPLGLGGGGETTLCVHCTTLVYWLLVPLKEKLNQKNSVLHVHFMKMPNGKLSSKLAQAEITILCMWNMNVMVTFSNFVGS